MALLKEMHGDPYQVLAAYHREVKEWPAIKPGNAAAFRRFSNFLVNCCCIMSESNWI